MGSVAYHVFLSPEGEPDLIHRAQHGDRVAVNDLLVRMRGLVESERRLFGIKDKDWRRYDAEQACYLAIERRIPRFDPSLDTQFRSFARAAARWALRDFVRTEIGVTLVEIGAAYDQARDGGKSVERFFAPEPVEGGWGSGAVADKVSSLHTDQQRLLFMEHGLGYSRAEIARSLGVSRSAVTQRMHHIELALVS